MKKQSKRIATYKEHRNLALNMLEMEMYISINKICAKTAETYHKITTTRKLNYTKEIKEKIKRDLHNPKIWEFGEFKTKEQMENNMNICIKYIDEIENNLNLTK